MEVAAVGCVRLIAEVLDHLDREAGLEYLLGEIPQQTARADQVGSGLLNKLFRDRRIELRRSSNSGFFFDATALAGIVNLSLQTYPRVEPQHFRPHQICRSFQSPKPERDRGK